MTFLSDLLASAESPSSAYLQFLTEKGREEYVAFAFVEDEDDIAFYQHVLSDTANICFLGCGGKSGVFAVLDRLEHEGRADGHLFMVDRDHEEPPFDRPEVMRTRAYSWEAHLCAPGVVRLCVQRKARPNLSAGAAEQFEGLWVATLEAFGEAARTHAALLRMRNAPGASLGIGDMRLAAGAVMIDGVLQPAPELSGRLHVAIEQAAFSKEEEIAFKDCLDVYASRDVTLVGRGKNLFTIFREFLRGAVLHLGSELVEQINSPLHVLSCTRWDHPDFDYIRDYVRERIRSA